MAPPPAIKLIALLCRKKTMTREVFQLYYELFHAPLAIKLAPFMSKYTIDFVVVKDPTATNTLEAKAATFDVVTQMWFDTEEDFNQFNIAMVKPDSRRLLIADEEKFLDREASQIFIVKTCQSDLDKIGRHSLAEKI